MKFINILLVIFFSSFASVTLAQNTLSLERAIEMALEENYGINIAQNTAKAADNSATAGNAGLLPKVDLTARAGLNLNNSKVTFASGDERKATGILTDNENIGLNVNYTLLTNTYTLKLLKQQASLSHQQARAQIEQSIVQITNAYYLAARLSQQKDIFTESLAVSRSRLARVQAQREFGSGSRLAVLNAEVNFNTDSINYLASALNLRNAKEDLRNLIPSLSDEDFGLETQVTFVDLPQAEALIQKAIANNSSLELAKMGQGIAEMNLKIIKATKLPRLDLSTGYSFSRAANGPLSFAPLSSGNGLNASANLSFNLFNGGVTKTRINNASLELASSRLRYDQAQKLLLTQFRKAWANYQNGRSSMELEEKSGIAARLNFTQTQSRFKLGQATGTQFREAQLNLIQAENRLNNLRFDLKVFETELLRLMGDL